MRRTIIDTDLTRVVPAEWTNDQLIDLFHHARNLGINGSPGGYILTVDLFEFVGTENDDSRALLPSTEWDFDGMRAWIRENLADVTLAWQRFVRTIY